MKVRFCLGFHTSTFVCNSVLAFVSPGIGRGSFFFRVHPLLLPCTPFHWHVYSSTGVGICWQTYEFLYMNGYLPNHVYTLLLMCAPFCGHSCTILLTWIPPSWVWTLVLQSTPFYSRVHLLTCVYPRDVADLCSSCVCTISEYDCTLFINVYTLLLKCALFYCYVRSPTHVCICLHMLVPPPFTLRFPSPLALEAQNSEHAFTFLLMCAQSYLSMHPSIARHTLLLTCASVYMRVYSRDKAGSLSIRDCASSEHAGTLLLTCTPSYLSVHLYITM